MSLPNRKVGDFYEIDGFIVYREYVEQNPHTFELELCREPLCQCEWEDGAKDAVNNFTPDYPEDKVYYEAGRILV